MSNGERTYVVVQCCQCNTFQVQIITKTDRYRCSVCGNKQTRGRVFARSSKARDCREVVANYNHQRHVPEPENIEPRREIPTIKSDTNWSEYIEDGEDPQQATLLQGHTTHSSLAQQTRRKRKAIDKDDEYNRRSIVGSQTSTDRTMKDTTAHDVSLQLWARPADHRNRNTFQTGTGWDDYLDD